jgi:hypothetical protein
MAQLSDRELHCSISSTGLGFGLGVLRLRPRFHARRVFSN